MAGDYEEQTKQSGLSSRRAADLSLERLYRKRAIDRENQRARREGAKSQLLKLENEVCELKRKLQVSDQQRSTLQSQNESMSTAIKSVVSTLNFIPGSPDVSSNWLGFGQWTETPSDSTWPSEDIESRRREGPSGKDDMTIPDYQTFDPDVWASEECITFPMNASDAFKADDFSLDLTSLAVGSAATSQDTNGSSSDTIHAESLQGHSNSHSSGRYNRAMLEINRLRDSTPLWSITPSFCLTMSSIDELITDLIRRKKSDTETGRTMEEFQHASFPSVASLLNPDIYEPDKPVASTIARHVAGVIRVKQTPEKVALLYMICLLIRWLICPTKEHYNAIPEFFRPTGLQLAIPHPVWLATIGWPEARNRLIEHMDFTTYQTFADLIVESFSINWPTGLEGIIERSPERGFILTQDFVQHVRNPKNWTVGTTLIRNYPFLEGAVKVKEDLN